MRSEKDKKEGSQDDCLLSHWVDLRELETWTTATGFSVTYVGIFSLVFSSHLIGGRVKQPELFFPGPLRTPILTGREYPLR